MLAVLRGESPVLDYPLTALNACAARPAVREGLRVIGGNSLLLSALKGSVDFTPDTRGAVVFIESVANGPGELSRLLDGFLYAPMLRDASAVMFGDLIQTGGQPNPPPCSSSSISPASPGRDARRSRRAGAAGREPLRPWIGESALAAEHAGDLDAGRQPVAVAAIGGRHERRAPQSRRRARAQCLCRPQPSQHRRRSDAGADAGLVGVLHKVPRRATPSSIRPMRTAFDRRDRWDCSSGPITFAPTTTCPRRSSASWTRWRSPAPRACCLASTGSPIRRPAKGR
ncbi:LD-carboxypeptidase domain-containing protein [Ditylenchus destructor]|nr:LD-carboxypeptidase domain-containing protein [Ditylenchus destructor]